MSGIGNDFQLTAGPGLMQGKSLIDLADHIIAAMQDKTRNIL